MTSVLFGGGLNYQRNNPLQAEIRGLRADIEDLRRLVEDVTYRLDKAGIAPLPEEVASAPAPVAAPVYNPAPPGPAPAPTAGTGRRRG
jgi:hypothetical protein